MALVNGSQKAPMKVHPGHMEPSVKVGRLLLPTNSEGMQPLRIRPNLWDDSGLSVDLRAMQQTQSENLNLPSARHSVHSSIDHGSERPNFGVRLRPIPQPQKKTSTDDLIADHVYYSKMRHRKHKSAHRSKTASEVSSRKDFRSFQPVVFEPRTVPRTVKYLREARNERWKTPEPERKGKIEKIAFKPIRGMHKTPRTDDSQLKSPTVTASLLHERLTQDILRQFGTDVDHRDNVSHASVTSARDLILTHGHATGVPNQLRHVPRQEDSPRRKVRSWLSDHD